MPTLPFISYFSSTTIFIIIKKIIVSQLSNIKSMRKNKNTNVLVGIKKVYVFIAQKIVTTQKYEALDREREWLNMQYIIYWTMILNDYCLSAWLIIQNYFITISKKSLTLLTGVVYTELIKISQNTEYTKIKIFRGARNLFT